MTDPSDGEVDATEPVVRLLYQAGVGLSPDGIAANLEAYLETPPSESAVRRALSGLESRDVVRPLESSGEYYVLTEHGRDYAEMEIDQEAVGFVE